MDSYKKILHLKNFFETSPSNERFLEEKEWIIEIYNICCAELVNLHRTVERQSVVIEQMRDHIEANFVHFKKPQSKKEQDIDEETGQPKKSKQIWIKKTKKKSSDSKNS